MLGLSISYTIPLLIFSFLYFGTYPKFSASIVSIVLFILSFLVLLQAGKQRKLGFRENRTLSQKILFVFGVMFFLAAIAALVAVFLPHEENAKIWVIRSSALFSLAFAAFLTNKEWQELKPRDRLVYFLTVAVSPPTILGFFL